MINKIPQTITLAIITLILLTLSPQPVALAQSDDTAAGSQLATYTVKSGDTLFAIARLFDITPQSLINANNIVNPNLLFVGQELTIPNPAPLPVDTPTPAQPATPTDQPIATSAPATPTPATSTPVAQPNQSPWTDPAAAIELFSPVAQTSYHSPIEIVGFSQTFEAAVDIRLVDQNGLILAERFASGGGVEYDFFQTYIRFFVNEPTNATLQLFQNTGQDDDPAPDTSVDITLLPGGQRAIDLLSPRVNAKICNDINVGGYSLTFEGSVPVTLAERDGTEISVVPATGGGVDFRDWGLSLPNIATDTPRAILLSVHESSARDGSTIDMTRIPISLYPAGHPDCATP